LLDKWSSQKRALESVKQAVRYVATEHYQGVIFWRPKNLWPYIYMDLDYAIDKDDQRSISGQVSTLRDMLVGWSSKKIADCVIKQL